MKQAKFVWSFRPLVKPRFVPLSYRMYLIYHGCLGYFVPYHFRETETGSSQLLTECCHPTFHNQSRSRTHVSLETPPSNFFDSYFQAPNQLEFAKKEEKEQVPPLLVWCSYFYTRKWKWKWNWSTNEPKRNWSPKMKMDLDLELDLEFGFIGTPSNSIFISETKMEMELEFQWTGGWIQIQV